MTIITIERDRLGHIIDVSLCGHTDYAKENTDIVCAGVSALTQTALLGLNKYLSLDVKYKVAKGQLEISLGDKANEQTDIILETMLLGLQEIAHAYPKYVRIQEIGGEDNV